MTVDPLPLVVPPRPAPTLDDARVERVRAALADVDQLAGPNYGLVTDFEAILAVRRVRPFPVPLWIVVEDLCVTAQCSDCGQPVEDSDIGTIHYSSIEQARSSLAPSEDDADPPYAFVAGDDLVCSSCRETRECKAADADPRTRRDHQWREISRPPTMRGIPPKLWVCDNCGEHASTDPSGPPSAADR